MELTPTAWLLVSLGAFLVGLGKGGLPGAGNLTIYLFAVVFGPKPSVGILLPVLICGDIVAIIVYRRHAEWKYLKRLLPPTLAGILIGWGVFEWIPARIFGTVIGVILLLMTALHFFRRWLVSRQDKDAEDLVPHTWWFITGTGLAGGLATMLANAAGAIASFYLMAVRLPKYAFIGTTAWFFFIVNVCKIPLMVDLGIISFDSIGMSLSLGIFAVMGALIAPRLVKHIRQDIYEKIIWILIIIAGLRLIF